MASVHDSAISSRGPAVKSKEWTNARAAGTLGLVVEYTKRTEMILSEPMRRAVVGRMVLVARTAKGEVAEGAERCLLHPGCVPIRGGSGRLVQRQVPVLEPLLHPAA